MTHTFGGEVLDIPEGWQEVEGRLMREFQFEDYSKAKQFVDVISSIFEQLNHHADVHFGWGYVVLELYTHDAGAITSQDIELALQISEVASNE